MYIGGGFIYNAAIKSVMMHKLTHDYIDKLISNKEKQLVAMQFENQEFKKSGGVVLEWDPSPVEPPEDEEDDEEDDDEPIVVLDNEAQLEKLYEIFDIMNEYLTYDDDDDDDEDD